MQNSSKMSEIKSVFSHAFRLWSGSLTSNLIFSLFYFSILFTLTSFALNYFGINKDIEAFAPLMQSNPDAFMEKMKELAVTENYSNFLLALIAIKSLLFPLNIGMLNTYHIQDKTNSSSFMYLFSGYRGLNFFKYFGYAIFWNSVYFLMPAPLMLIWILVTFLVSPLMLFFNQSSFKSIGITFTVLKTRIVLLLVATLLAIGFSYAGVLFFGFGILLTFPFWNAMVYAVFREVFQSKD